MNFQGENIKQQLIDKIENKKALIGVVGLGYVGLPLIREFLKAGFKVLGFDIDTKKINILNSGKSYIKHINNKFINKYISLKKFIATSDMTRFNEPDIIIICVPSPIGEHFEPNLSFIIDTTKKISLYIRRGQLIILESTTYPGTTENNIKPILESSGLIAGQDFYLGFSPEREDPGNKDYSAKTITKIVSGYSADALTVITKLYNSIIDNVYPISSTKVAESAKLLENIYRAVNIALVNELKLIFTEMDIDIWEVIKAAATKPFGFQAFYPGPGPGGHCIPVDPFYLTWKAREYGMHTRFIELAGEINNSMPKYVVNTTIKALNSKKIPINSAKILILGVAYKPDIDDMRESPALKIIEEFLKYDTKIKFNDPFFKKLPKTRKHNFKIQSVKLTPENLTRFDVVVIVTNHSNYDYDMILQNSNLIIDTRNVYKLKSLKNGKIWKS